MDIVFYHPTNIACVDLVMGCSKESSYHLATQIATPPPPPSLSATSVLTYGVPPNDTTIGWGSHLSPGAPFTHCAGGLAGVHDVVVWLGAMELNRVQGRVVCHLRLNLDLEPRIGQRRRN